MRIETLGLDTFCAALRAKNYKNFKPGGSLETPFWNRGDMRVRSIRQQITFL